MSNTNQTNQPTEYKSVFRDKTVYVTPGRLLRRLKSRNDYPVCQPKSIDKATADRCAIGRYIYGEITSNYLPLLTGGVDVHARHHKQVSLGNSLTLDDAHASVNLKTLGEWNYEEFLLLSAMLPLNPIQGGAFSGSVQGVPDTTLERVIEGYVLAASVLFPNKIRVAALKVLLTHCGSGSIEFQRIGIVSKLAGLYRKKYGRDLFADNPSEREKYYLGTWFSFCPYFTFQARFEASSFTNYTQSSRLVDRVFLAKNPFGIETQFDKQDFITAHPTFAWGPLFGGGRRRCGTLTLRRKWSDSLVCWNWDLSRVQALASHGLLACCW